MSKADTKFLNGSNSLKLQLHFLALACRVRPRSTNIAYGQNSSDKTRAINISRQAVASIQQSMFDKGTNLMAVFQKGAGTYQEAIEAVRICEQAALLFLPQEGQKDFLIIRRNKGNVEDDNIADVAKAFRERTPEQSGKKMVFYYFHKVVDKYYPLLVTYNPQDDHFTIDTSRAYATLDKEKAFSDFKEIIESIPEIKGKHVAHVSQRTRDKDFLYDKKNPLYTVLDLQADYLRRAEEKELTSEQIQLELDATFFPRTTRSDLRDAKSRQDFTADGRRHNDTQFFQNSLAMALMYPAFVRAQGELKPEAAQEARRLEQERLEREEDALRKETERKRQEEEVARRLAEQRAAEEAAAQAKKLEKKQQLETKARSIAELSETAEVLKLLAEAKAAVESVGGEIKKLVVDPPADKVALNEMLDDAQKEILKAEKAAEEIRKDIEKAVEEGRRLNTAPDQITAIEAELGRIQQDVTEQRGLVREAAAAANAKVLAIRQAMLALTTSAEQRRALAEAEARRLEEQQSIIQAALAEIKDASASALSTVANVETLVAQLHREIAAIGAREDRKQDLNATLLQVEAAVKEAKAASARTQSNLSLAEQEVAHLSSNAKKADEVAAALFKLQTHVTEDKELTDQHVAKANQKADALRQAMATLRSQLDSERAHPPIVLPRNELLNFNIHGVLYDHLRATNRGDIANAQRSYVYIERQTQALYTRFLGGIPDDRTRGAVANFIYDAAADMAALGAGDVAQKERLELAVNRAINDPTTMAEYPEIGSGVRKLWADEIKYRAKMCNGKTIPGDPRFSNPTVAVSAEGEVFVTYDRHPAFKMLPSGQFQEGTTPPWNGNCSNYNIALAALEAEVIHSDCPIQVATRAELMGRTDLISLTALANRFFEFKDGCKKVATSAQYEFYQIGNDELDDGIFCINPTTKEIFIPDDQGLLHPVISDGELKTFLAQNPVVAPSPPEQLNFVKMPPLRYNYHGQFGNTLEINYSVYKDSIIEADYKRARAENAYFLLDKNSFSEIAKSYDRSSGVRQEHNKNYLRNARIVGAALGEDFFYDMDVPLPERVSFNDCYLDMDLSGFDTQELQKVLRSLTFQNCVFGPNFKAPDNFQFEGYQFRKVEEINGVNVLVFDKDIPDKVPYKPLPPGTPHLVSVAKVAHTIAHTIRYL